MRDHDHLAVQARLRQAFVEGARALGPVLREVRGDLERCEVCRALYDRLARVEGIIKEGRTGRIWSSVVHSPALVGALGSLRGGRLRGWWRGEWPASWRSTAGVLAVAALLLLATTSALVGRSSAGRDTGTSIAQDGTFAVRGLTSSNESIGIRAFCIETAPPHEVLAEARSGGQLHCAPGRTVQVTYTSKVPVGDVTIALEREGRSTMRLGPTGQLPAGIDIPLPAAFAVPETPAGGECTMIVRFGTADGVVSQQIGLVWAL